MRIGELKRLGWNPLGVDGDKQPESGSSDDRNDGNPKRTDPAADSELEADLDPNDLLEILSNRRRRFLWRLLRRNSGELELNEASRRIAAWENGIDPEDVDYDQRKSVYNSLRQFHCKKMDEAGLIEFDKRESVVSLGPERPEELKITVEPDAEHALERILGALGVASAIVLGAWGLGLPVFGSLPLTAVLLSLGMGAAAAVFVYSLVMRTEFQLSLADALSRVDS